MKRFNKKGSWNDFVMSRVGKILLIIAFTVFLFLIIGKKVSEILS